MTPLEQAEVDCNVAWQKVCRAHELLVRAEHRRFNHKIIRLVADEYFQTQTEYGKCLKHISDLLLLPDPLL